ncbi:enoyl-CoA hydratase/isomerase family protein [Zhongshania aquimaris]|uniref:Enoyl-CoA hydratase/isomerase family protein n=1 Tax=Zhongshania aquimaris TaxID=2857107 RepID=A0ABS6VWU8_9GAMM|nr:enoyl-CoA hydratase/isomerase family protein [Zhongshania aquimaris]MBW2942751.1 enoyl-CoA hydratase/isomerase family protein [Zhongshania aquimaris]
MDTALIFPIQQLPSAEGWLMRQTLPVIAYGDGSAVNADVIVGDEAAAKSIEARIAKWPQAALVLVQVLRINETLPAAQGLDVESLAYSTLQGGPEFASWRQAQQSDETWPDSEGDALLLHRDGARMTASLNRPELRNSISLPMRDAFIEALQVLEADESLQELHFDAVGACFSVGGELREFGSSPDPVTAHWVRTVHSPARLIDKLRERVSFYLHGACIGSGVELPAFASKVVAHSKSYFQLPELQLGLIPGAGGTVGIARRIGRQRTAWMVLSGRRINAQTALAWGLVDELRD